MDSLAVFDFNSNQVRQNGEILANAAKRIMSAGRHNEQNITVKEVK
jgi:hypothetical protein